MIPKPTRWQSKKYRDAAKGQDCTMRLPGCRNETDTVVLAHRNGAGMGTKASDHDAADMCSYCHDIFDGRTLLEYGTVPFSWEVHRFMCGDTNPSKEFARARLETIVNRIERGILR